MKKTLALLLALVMVFTMCACGGNDTGSDANNDGALSGTVVIYSTQTDADHEVFLEVFNAQYPDVEVEFISGSLGELTARVDAEKENPQADIIFGGLSQTDGDTYHALLQPYTAKHTADSSIKDETGYYTYFTTQYICLLKNPSILAELGVDVNGYADLLQPELKGMIIQADPSASSSAWRQLQTMLYVMGDDFGDEKAWDYQEQLIANCDGVVTTSSSTCYKSVYSGEYAVGLSYDNGCISLVMNGADNVEIVWPEEGNTVCGFASAMVKDCPHPEAAAAVLDVLSGPDFQLAREKVAGSRGTNTTYTNDESFFPDSLDDMVVEMDFAKMTAEKKALIEKWTDLWAAANG